MGSDRLGLNRWTLCMLKARTNGWACWMGDKTFLKAWRGSRHEGVCPDLQTESIRKSCIWGPGTDRGPAATVHRDRIQSSACGHLYGYVPIDSSHSTFYQRGFTTYSALAIQSHQQNTNHLHLLLAKRHQMFWTPPSKSPLLTFTGTVVSQAEKSQKSLKCFTGLECACPSDTFSRRCLKRTHSLHIVRASKWSDRDLKRANRRGWQTYIIAQH